MQMAVSIFGTFGRLAEMRSNVLEFPGFPTRHYSSSWFNILMNLFSLAEET